MGIGNGIDRGRRGDIGRYMGANAQWFSTNSHLSLGDYLC